MEREEALWEPGIGEENFVLANEVEPVEIIEELSVEEDLFEIPEIPTTFSVSEESVLAEKIKPEPVWDLQEAKRKLKETKQQYCLEKKRQRRGPALWLVGVLCTLMGGILGAVLTWLFLNVIGK